MQRDISDPWLRGVKPPLSGRLEVWDSRVRGLVLRMTPNGVASSSVRARTRDGKRTRPTLGTWPALGVGEARKRALATIGEIQGGADPVALRKAARAAREAQAKLPTVGARLKEWQETRASAWSDRYQREVARLCEKEIVPRLGKSLLVETTREQWTDLIRDKHRRAPGVGSMLYRTCASFLNHAEAQGWISTPMLPRKGLSVIAPPVASRERVLSDDELRAIWKAADDLKPKFRAFVRLMLMTAAREMEAADIATGEVDLDAARWSIPGGRTKNGFGIVLPLHLCLVEDLRCSLARPRRGRRSVAAAWAIAGSGLRGFSKIKTTLDKDLGSLAGGSTIYVGRRAPG